MFFVLVLWFSLCFITQWAFLNVIDIRDRVSNILVIICFSFLIRLRLGVFARSLWILHLLILISDQGFMYIGDDSAAGNGASDQGVQLHISANGELQVARRYALYFAILRDVAGQLQDLGVQVLQNGGGDHGCSGSDPNAGCVPFLEVTVDPTHGKLEPSALRLRHLRLPIGPWSRGLSFFASHFCFTEFYTDH